MREWKFDLGGFVIRGKRWGQLGSSPVFALHGWLDNCASFDFVAPLMPELDLLALDLAGHGKSDHRPYAGAYNIWQDIQEVIAIADKLGWKKFGLLGHSRGGMIATLIAGTFPERVTHLAVIESFAPQAIEAKETPTQLHAAITSLLQMREKRRSLFASFDDAVKAREQGFLKLAHQDALLLAKRGVKEEGGQFFWNNDIKLNAPSEVKFTQEQVNAFLDRIDVHAELVIGNEGLANEFPAMREMMENTPGINVTRLPGEHHLHMSQQCNEVAKLLNVYFS